MRFSEQTLNILKQSGWWEGRGGNTAPLEEALKGAGFPVFPCVKEVLHNFGGLSINVSLPLPYVPDTLDFAIRDIVGRFDNDWVKQASEHTSKLLCPIGYFHDANVILMMNEDGNVYAKGMRSIVLLGRNMEETLENVLGPNLEWLEANDVDWTESVKELPSVRFDED